LQEGKKNKKIKQSSVTHSLNEIKKEKKLPQYIPNYFKKMKEEFDNTKNKKLYLRNLMDQFLPNIKIELDKTIDEYLGINNEESYDETCDESDNEELDE